MADGATTTFLLAAVLAAVLVGVVRHVVARQAILDHPNERSSHSVPTPRGGGAGLLLAAFALCGPAALETRDPMVVAALLAVAAVAAVGWLDDRSGVTVRRRLAVHIGAGVVLGLLATRGGWSGIAAVLVGAAWVFWTVSAINVVNFMDGINGLVASQIAVFCLSLIAFDGLPPSVTFAAALGGACVGFLPWNFPRARIFLGDVGSGGLGCCVPLLALLAMRGRGPGVVYAHLPLLPLFADASATLVRRWRSGERLTEAHRSHLYQRLANGGWGHARVTLAYTALAALGAVVAHRGDGKWSVVAYVAGVGAAGLILHRRVEAPAPLT
jgi:UDP-N-acetylmuramyl pentapeptide phosphotransferase/UDP-N-acetylglucosamine-1-phosphate transferase